MPLYDYYCEENDQTVEVKHSMGIKLKTWGQVCQHAKIDPGKTPKRTPVVRLIKDVRPMVFKLKGLDKDDYGTKLR